jgi:hypothetical protein
LYPETVYVAHAASAPDYAMIDTRFYSEKVRMDMAQLGLGKCTRHIAAAIKRINTQLEHAHSAATVKRKFLGRAAEESSNGAFAQSLTVPLLGFQTSGVDAVMRSFCGWMELGSPPADANKWREYYSDRCSRRWLMRSWEPRDSVTVQSQARTTSRSVTWIGALKTRP